MNWFIGYDMNGLGAINFKIGSLGAVAVIWSYLKPNSSLIPSINSIESWFVILITIVLLILLKT